MSKIDHLYRPDAKSGLAPDGHPYCACEAPKSDHLPCGDERTYVVTMRDVSAINRFAEKAVISLWEAWDDVDPHDYGCPDGLGDHSCVAAGDPGVGLLPPETPCPKCRVAIAFAGLRDAFSALPDEIKVKRVRQAPKRGA